MCLIMLEGNITFECGHYHDYPQPTPHANVCPFVDCRPVYSYIYRPDTFIPFPCEQCIRQGAYVYEPERDGTPGGPVHHWVRRYGNGNIVGPDSDPSLRVPLEAPESVTGKGYRMPQRVRISELPPGPALARTPRGNPRGTLEISLRRRLKQESRERKRAQQRRSDADSRGGVRRAEANTQDIKEDIRGAVQLILEKELRDLMKRKTYQDMTEEQVKREAWRIAYAEVNRVLLREMDNMMEETEEILDGDLAVMVERVKKEGVREEVKEEGEDEVKEEVKVKDESE